MKQFYVIFFFILISFQGFAQLFNGQVMDEKTKDPIPYVNIGIVGKGVGKVSDSNGNFSIMLDEKYNDDTIKISMIGYTPIYMKPKSRK